MPRAWHGRLDALRACSLVWEMEEGMSIHAKACKAYQEWLRKQPKEGTYRSFGAQMAFLEAFKIASKAIIRNKR